MKLLALLVSASLTLVLTACGEKGPPGASAQTPQAQGTPAANAVATTASHRDLAKGGTPVIDVRTPEEFAGGHVDGAINIPVDEVASRVGEFNKLVEGKDKKVVLYCRSGRRSAIAANVLRDQGFEVVDVGPMSAW